MRKGKWSERPPTPPKSPKTWTLSQRTEKRINSILTFPLGGEFLKQITVEIAKTESLPVPIQEESREWKKVAIELIQVLNPDILEQVLLAFNNGIYSAVHQKGEIKWKTGPPTWPDTKKA